MKRELLLRHLRRYGCIPRHVEIANLLANRICRKLSIPGPPG